LPHLAERELSIHGFTATAAVTISRKATQRMCGRYVIKSPPEAVRELFGYVDQPNFPPRYNIAPTQPVPIVRLVQGRRRFALVRWGLIPSWVKDPRTFTLLINARGESVLDKPAFRAAMRYRRCLFPVDGFYEWQVTPTGRRPYFVRPNSGGPMAFAGLWETWTGPNGEEQETAAIVTTVANRTLASIHARMPVIVDPSAFDLWLDTARIDSKTAAALIVPAPENLLEAYEISPAVNRIVNDSAELIEPHASSPQPTAPTSAAKPRRSKESGQGSLF
jgi:putative SOS response-associated peptidase YedK